MDQHPLATLLSSCTPTAHLWGRLELGIHQVLFLALKRLKWLWIPAVHGIASQVAISAPVVRYQSCQSYCHWGKHDWSGGNIIPASGDLDPEIWQRGCWRRVPKVISANIGKVALIPFEVSNTCAWSQSIQLEYCTRIHCIRIWGARIQGGLQFSGIPNT